MNKFQNIMVIWLIVGLAFWAYYAIVIEFQFTLLYFFILSIGFGVPTYVFKERITKVLRSIPINPGLRFILLGYAAVILEEIFAALSNHLSEGFQINLYLERVLQFWAFNILAFTGFIVGWYFLIRWFKYSNTEIFFIAGAWGLWAEGIIFLITSNPIGLFFMAPIMIFVYGLIITPAMLSVEKTGKRKLNLIVKVILTYAVCFIFSIIPLIILNILRSFYPWLFPPPNFIPL